MEEDAFSSTSRLPLQISVDDNRSTATPSEMENLKNMIASLTTTVTNRLDVFKADLDEFKAEQQKFKDKYEETAGDVDKSLKQMHKFMTGAGVTTDVEFMKNYFIPAVDKAVGEIHEDAIAKVVENTLLNNPSLDAQAKHYGNEFMTSFQQQFDVKATETERRLNELVKEKCDLGASIISQTALTVTSNLHGCLNTQLCAKGASVAQLGELESLMKISATLPLETKVWLSGNDFSERDVPQLVPGADGSVSTHSVPTKEASVLIGVPHLSSHFQTSLRCDPPTTLEILRLHSLASSALSSTSDSTKRRGLSSVKIEECLAANLDKLPHAPTFSEFVEWWDKMCGRLPNYGILLCPLDAWEISKYGDVGFLLPGMGIRWTWENSRHLFTVLADLLPQDSSMTALFIRSGNSGTKVLYNLLTTSYKFLDPDFPLTAPSMENSGDVSTLARNIRNYSRILAARGSPRSDKATSLHFINVLSSDSAYAAAAASYRGMVERAPSSSSTPWPHHLELMQLATVFDGLTTKSNSSAMTFGYGAATVRTLHAPTAPVSAVDLSLFDGLFDNIGAIQGFAQASKTLSRGGPRGGRNKTTPPVYHEVSSKRKMDLGVICEACKRPGHDASRCFILAQFLWILRFQKEHPAECLQYAKQWVADQQLRAEKRRLKSNAPSPPSVVTPQAAMVYCSSKGLTVDAAFSQMDWEYLDCDDPRALLVDEGDCCLHDD
jgi:hypothetical protein